VCNTAAYSSHLGCFFGLHRELLVRWNLAHTLRQKSVGFLLVTCHVLLHTAGLVFSINALTMLQERVAAVITHWHSLSLWPIDFGGNFVLCCIFLNIQHCPLFTGLWGLNTHK
jgi:hypothetical protein